MIHTVKLYIKQIKQDPGCAMLNIAKWSKQEFIGAIALEPALLTWKASTELTIVVTIPLSTLTTTIFDAGYISTELGLGHLLVRLEQMSVVS